VVIQTGTLVTQLFNIFHFVLEYFWWSFRANWWWTASVVILLQDFVDERIWCFLQGWCFFFIFYNKSLFFLRSGKIEFDGFLFQLVWAVCASRLKVQIGFNFIGELLWCRFFTLWLIWVVPKSYEFIHILLILVIIKEMNFIFKIVY
jgi:hypothetical protein